MMYVNPENQGWNSFIKFLITVLPAIGVYIGVSMRSGKRKFISIIISAFVGSTFAWIMNPVVQEYFSESWYPAVIGFLAITGDKISYWFIFTFKIGDALDRVQAKIEQYFTGKK